MEVALEMTGAGPTRLRVLGAGLAVGGADLRTGAEVVAGAADDDHPDGIVGDRVLDGGGDTVEHGRVHRVALVGTLQRDPQDRTVGDHVEALDRGESRAHRGAPTCGEQLGEAHVVGVGCEVGAHTDRVDVGGDLLGPVVDADVGLVLAGEVRGGPAAVVAAGVLVVEGVDQVVDPDGHRPASRVVAASRAPQHDGRAARLQRLEDGPGERPQRRAGDRVDEAGVDVERPDLAHVSRSRELSHVTSQSVGVSRSIAERPA